MFKNTEFVIIRIKYALAGLQGFQIPVTWEQEYWSAVIHSAYIERITVRQLFGASFVLRNRQAAFLNAPAGLGRCKMKQTISRRIRSCVAVLAAVLLMTALVVPCTAKEESKVIRVAFPQAEGYTMTAADGTRYGLVVDFLQEISKYTGWTYEYVDANSTNLLDQFFSGEFDLMGGTYYADGFEEYFAYPQYNCGYSKLTLMARKQDASIRSYDLSSFNGKTIGVFERNTENIRRLKEYLLINDLDCQLKYYSFEELSVTGDLNRFLENGDVDLLLGNNTAKGDNLYIAASFNSQPHFIVTSLENKEVLDGLNMALEKIYECDPNFAVKLYDKHFPATGFGYSELNAEELSYVSRQKKVKVAVPATWHPMFCKNSSGDMHDGFIPDILHEVTEFSGLEFEYVYCDSYAQSVSKVLGGEADILGFYLGSQENAEQQGLALTEPYVDLDSILVRNKESTYPSEGLVGAVLEGRELPSDIVADEVRYYADASQALSDVNRGKVDFFYGISTNLENIIQKENFTNLVQVNLVNNNTQISFAVPSPAHPQLFTILNKAINNLTEEQKNTISSRNVISIGESQMSLSGIIYANPALAISVVSAFLLLVLIAVALTARFRIHAAVMRTELEKAEANSRAKSEFLSRMSHEIRTPMNAIMGLTDLTCMVQELPERAKENLEKIKSSSYYLLSLINDILDMSRIENGKMELINEPFSLHGLLLEIESMMKNEAVDRGLCFSVQEALQEDVLVGDAVRLRQVLLNLLSNAFKFTPSGGCVKLNALQDTAAQDGASQERVSVLFQVSDTGVGIAPEDQKRIFLSFEQVGSNVARSQGTGLGLSISGQIVHLMGGRIQLKSEPGKGSEFFFTISFSKGKLEQKSAEQMPEPAQPLSGVGILLVEDNDLNAEIATELLEVQGAVVTRAQNGKEAVEMFQQSAPGAYRIILMDILMPELNGLQATKQIRGLLRPDALEIPIIAMTANTFKEDVNSAMEAGMTDFIPKPINVEHLYEVLRKSLGYLTEE